MQQQTRPDQDDDEQGGPEGARGNIPPAEQPSVNIGAQGKASLSQPRSASTVERQSMNAEQRARNQIQTVDDDKSVPHEVVPTRSYLRRPTYSSTNNEHGLFYVPCRDNSL
eukprot:SAG11_NODE_18467_length_491_cov_1.035806_1_plen_110_part_10